MDSPTRRGLTRSQENPCRKRFALCYCFSRMMAILETSPLTFNSWENFYVIVGSSAGALTGLQFVVITLIAEGRTTGNMNEVRAFGTPTVVHFCVALLIAAIASCPWQSLTQPAVALAACGVAGVVYILNALRHARRGTNYKPDLEDWIWYSWLPLLAYLFLFAASLLLIGHPQAGLFSIAAVSLLLLFLGIRNAWDTVTFIAIQHHGANRAQKSASAHPEPGNS